MSITTRSAGERSPGLYRPGACPRAGEPSPPTPRWPRANQLLWLTYAPITTATAEHFDVSESAVGWLSQVFPLLYVVLAIPAGLALDRRFRRALLTGAWLTAVGGAVRLGIGHVRRRAGRTDPDRDRAAADPQRGHQGRAHVGAGATLAQGISLGSAGIFAGTALALPLGPALGDAESLMPLLVVDLVVAVAAAAWLTARCAASRWRRRAAAGRAAARTRRLRAVSARRAGARGSCRRRSWARPRHPAPRRGRVPRLRRLRRAHHLAAGAARARGRLRRDRRLAAGRDGARRRRRLRAPARAARPAPRGADVPARRGGRRRRGLRVPRAGARAPPSSP